MIRRLHLFFVLFAPASILLAGVATPAHGGVIRLVTSTTLTGDTLSLHIANEGDETAFNLQARIRISGEERNSPPLANLPARASAEFPFVIQAPTRTGSHAVEFLVDYTDANLYPFSMPLVHLIRVGAAGRPDVFGAFAPIRLAGSTKAQLHLRNQGETPRTVRVALHGPREVTIDSPELTVTLGPRQERVLSVPLRNFSAPPRSRFPLFAVLSYDDAAGDAFASYARGEVETVVASRFAALSFWVVPGLTLLVLGLVLLTLRVTRHLRQVRAALAPSHPGVRP